MNLIENYNKALQAIYDHVGFVEDWVVYQIEDAMEMYWVLDEDTVTYAETKELFDGDGYDLYDNAIYKQRFYDKWVYEGKDFTMIFCDTGFDGMKYFKLFDNKKRLVYNEHGTLLCYKW